MPRHGVRIVDLASASATKARCSRLFVAHCTRGVLGSANESASGPFLVALVALYTESSCAGAITALLCA